MKFRSFLHRILKPGNLLAAALSIAFFFLLHASVSLICVSGGSMDPTLADGQRLIGLRVNNIPFMEVARGDIVTARSPENGTLLIKRIIALSGDLVELKDGQLYLNGQLQYEPYIYEPMVDIPLNDIPAFTVPDGQCFLLGDNRNISKDSRMLGCVKLEDIYSMIPLHAQAIAGSALAVCLMLAVRLICSLSNAADLRWEAYLAVKNARASAQSDTPPETEPEERSEEPPHASY